MDDEMIIEPEEIELDIFDEEDSTGLQEETVEESDLTYPCVLVSGLMLEEELDFLSRFFDSESDVINLYVSFEGVTKRIGNFMVNLENILILRDMGYESSLYLPDGTVLDLNDTNLYTKFIRV